MSSKRVHLQMEITEIQGFESSLHPFSPTSALGSGSMHDMRQSVYGTYIQCTVDYLGHDSPSSRDLFLNHYSPMGDPLLSAAKPKLPESLGNNTLSRKRENCLTLSPWETIA